MALVSVNSASAGDFRLLKFRAHQLSVLQSSSSGGTSFTGEVGWNPVYRLNEDMSIVGNFAGGLLLGTGNSLFTVLTYQALFSYDLDPTWVVEAGAGGQTWMQNPSTTALLVGVNGGYKLTEKLFGLIDRFVLGYNVLLAGTTAHQIRAGLQVSF